MLRLLLRVFFAVVFMAACYFPVQAAGIDTTYIRRFRHQITVNGFTDFRLASLSYENGNDEQSYRPNSGPGLGLGLSWQGLAFNSRVVSFKGEKDKGETSGTDLQWHWFMRRIQLSFTLQNYKGFYTEDGDNDNAIILRPDLRIRQYRLFSQYIFNSKRFSYRAAFMNDEQQLQSAGGILAGFGIYGSTILADSTLVIGGTDKTPQEITNFQVGPNLGYAYTFVIKDNWFITTSLTLGASWSKIKKNGIHETKIYANLFPRIAFGYNFPRSAICVTTHFSRSYISSLENAATSLDAMNVQLIYSYRFNFETKSKFFKRIEKWLNN